MRGPRGAVAAALVQPDMSTFAECGLGLAIAQGLVEAQGGRIWAENRPTGGARLAFTLPLARAHSLAEAAVD